MFNSVECDNNSSGVQELLKGAIMSYHNEAGYAPESIVHHELACSHIPGFAIVFHKEQV